MNPYNFWLVKAGEPAVFSEKQKNMKPLRTGMIAKSLLESGHRVTWWTGNFQHHDKSFIGPKGEHKTSIVGKLTMEYAPSPGYKKNISIQRFIDHRALANNMEKKMTHRDKPNLIYCSWPPVETSELFLNFALEENIPYVLDVRDQWPDVIYRRLGSRFGLSKFPRFLLSYEKAVKRCFSHATSVISISPTFLDWVYRRSGRLRNSKDIVCPLSSEDLSTYNSDNGVLTKFWLEKGVCLSDSKLRIVLVGTLTKQRSFLRFIDAILHERVPKQIQLVVCGTGQLEEYLKNIQSDKVVYAGYVGRDHMSCLMAFSHIGLLAYDPTEDFTMSIPNKVGEYLSGGLHILTNLKGEISKLLDNTGAMSHFEPEDPENIVDCILALYNQKELLLEKRNTSRKLFLENLSAKVNYSKLINNFEVLIEDFKVNDSH